MTSLATLWLLFGFTLSLGAIIITLLSYCQLQHLQQLWLDDILQALVDTRQAVNQERQIMDRAQHIMDLTQHTMDRMQHIIDERAGS